MFIWHTGEERGLYGSRFFADYPKVETERIVAQLNMDMVGRNRDDKPEESNTVYLVGSDRISSQLHNLGEDTNAALPRPLKLDYEMNDAADREQVYYRSDHFSYAAYGIPIVFYTTGLHPDYHVNTDHVEKIEFDKMARIGQLVLKTGLASPTWTTSFCATTGAPAWARATPGSSPVPASGWPSERPASSGAAAAGAARPCPWPVRPRASEG